MPFKLVQGWRPDAPDGRDLCYSAIHRVPRAEPLPVRASLRGRLPPVWDQGQIGSCVGHGTGALIAFIHSGFMPSRLQIYGQARRIEGAFKTDSGCQIRDAIKQLAALGVAPETDWPYITAKFNKPWPSKATKDARTDIITDYSRLTTGEEYRDCLAAGHPIAFGATLYESFESPAVARSGIVPVPQKHERPLGGHCMAIIGYDDAFSRGEAAGRYYEVRNSWSTAFGDAGHVWIPAAYIENTNLTDDFWTVRA